MYWNYGFRKRPSELKMRPTFVRVVVRTIFPVRMARPTTTRRESFSFISNSSRPFEWMRPRRWCFCSAVFRCCWFHPVSCGNRFRRWQSFRLAAAVDFSRSDGSSSSSCIQTAGRSNRPIWNCWFDSSFNVRFDISFGGSFSITKSNKNMETKSIIHHIITVCCQSSQKKFANENGVHLQSDLVGKYQISKIK